MKRCKSYMRIAHTLHFDLVFCNTLSWININPLEYSRIVSSSLLLFPFRLHFMSQISKLERPEATATAAARGSKKWNAILQHRSVLCICAWCEFTITGVCAPRTSIELIKKKLFQKKVTFSQYWMDIQK